MSPLDRSIMAKTLTAAVNVRAGARGANDRLRVTCKDAMTVSINTKTASFELVGGVFFSRAKGGTAPASQRDQRNQRRAYPGSDLLWQPANTGETITLEGYLVELPGQA